MEYPDPQVMYETMLMMSRTLVQHPKLEPWQRDICKEVLRAADRRDPQGRYICSPARPYIPGDPDSWVHPAATEVGEQADGWPGGDIITMHCSVCGHRWTQELAQ